MLENEPQVSRGASWRDKLPAPRQMAKNLSHNWFFPLSALPYFFSEIQGAEYNTGALTLALAFVVLLAVALYTPELWQTTRTLPWFIQCWALLTAAGVCWHAYSHGATFFTADGPLAALTGMLADVEDFPRALAVCCGILGFPFVYTSISYVWQTLARLVKKLGILQFSRLEWLLYAVLALALVAYAGWAFYSSTGFYSATNDGYDIVYTADTDTLFNNWAYLSLTYVENDLRQPLFAVFSAPFTGLPYLLSQLLQLPVPTTAVLLNSVQVLMLYAANLMLASLAVHSAAKRVCFVLALSATYTVLLNAIMLEQYVTAYFWLMLTVAAIVTRHTEEPLGAFGAMGALLTNAAVLPWMSAHCPWRHPLKWLGNMLALGLGFIALIIGMARFDVLYSIVPKLASLLKFTGTSIPPGDRLREYLAFVHDCFVQPAAHVAQGVAPDGILSWRLDTVASWNICGIVLLSLMALSMILNRHDRLTQFAGYWVAISFVLLAVIGWGTWENGLILYSLYFGWVYFLLLYRLLERLAEKLHAHWLTPIGTLAAAAGMLYLNVPAILELIAYCVKYFPL